MGSQRWVSDMQSPHVLDSGSGSEAGETAAVDSIGDNVVALFAPREGSVAAVIAAASEPAEDAELAGEDEIRATFRAVMLERPPSTQRRHRLAPFAIAAGSVVGLVAGTTGLSAAAVLPPAANHVVARVLAQVGIHVAPTSTPAPTTTAIRSDSPPPASTPVTTTPSTPPPSANTPAGAPAVTHTPPTRVVRTCNVSVTVAGVRSNAEIEVTATNAASALAATPAIASKGHCSLNRGTPSTGTAGGGKGTSASGGGGPSTGSGTTTGPGTGTGSGKGTNKGGHHGKGRHGKHGGQGGTGTGTGTDSGTGTGSGTGTAPLGGTTTTTVPSTGPVTSDDPLGSSS
jgi:hypothetical protein